MGGCEGEREEKNTEVLSQVIKVQRQSQMYCAIRDTELNKKTDTLYEKEDYILKLKVYHNYCVFKFIQMPLS